MCGNLPLLVGIASFFVGILIYADDLDCTVVSAKSSPYIFSLSLL